MKVEVEKMLYETVEIDDKFKPLFEKFRKADSGDPTVTYTDEEEELWDELIRLATKNDWCTGYCIDEVDKKEYIFWMI